MNDMMIRPDLAKNDFVVYSGFRSERFSAAKSRRARSFPCSCLIRNPASSFLKRAAARTTGRMRCKHSAMK